MGLPAEYFTTKRYDHFATELSNNYVRTGTLYAPGLVQRLLEFYALVGRWLRSLEPEQARTSCCIFYNIVHDCSAVFDHTVQAASVPEHVVSDMAFVIDHLGNHLPMQLMQAIRSGAPLEHALQVMVVLTHQTSPLKNPLVKESFVGVLRRLLERDAHPQARTLWN
jgi:hypothetical protein